MKFLTIAACAVTALLPATALAQAKPCALITQQQAEAIYGGALHSGSESGPTCAFAGPRGADQQGVTVGILPASDDSWDALIHQDPQNIITPQAGLADKADFVTKPGTKGGGLVVQFHGKILTIEVNAPVNGGFKDTAIKTARAVMQKLG